MEVLEKLAERYADVAIDKHEQDENMAREYISFSWGVYRFLENVDGMTLATEIMQYMGLNKFEIKEHQNYGYDCIVLGVDEAYKIMHELHYALIKVAEKKNEKR